MNVSLPSLSVLQAASEALASVKGDAKVAKANADNAFRTVTWEAFDALQADATQADAIGDAIATARGVKAEAFAVYRQRARFLVTYASTVAKAGETRMVTHGANKGAMVNGRDTVSAFNVAQKAHDTAKENAEARAKVAADMPLQRQAVADIAEREGMSEDEVNACLQMKGDIGAEAWDKVHAQMDMIRAKAAARANLGTALQAIRDALQEGAFASLDGAAASIGADDFGSFLADCMVSRREAFTQEADIAQAA